MSAELEAWDLVLEWLEVGILLDTAPCVAMVIGGTFVVEGDTGFVLALKG